jgi:hypothetical protein
MLTAMPAPSSAPVNASLVNWLPWSVLKISGFLPPPSARSRARRQKSVSSVGESSQCHGAG